MVLSHTKETLFPKGMSCFSSLSHYYVKRMTRENAHHILSWPSLKGGKPYYLRRSTDSSAEAREKESGSHFENRRIVFRHRHSFGTRSKPHAGRKIEGDSTDCIIHAVVTSRSISDWFRYCTPSRRRIGCQQYRGIVTISIPFQSDVSTSIF